MCGIAGIINASNNPERLNAYISVMTNCLKHRGPDDSGYLIVSDNNQTSTAGDNDTARQSWDSNYPYTPKQHIGELNQPAQLAFGHRRLSVIDVSAGGHQPMCNVSGDLWMLVNGEIYNYIELRDELRSLGHQFSTKSDSEVLLKAYEAWGFNCLSKLNGMWSFVIYDKKRNIIFGARDRSGVKPLYYFNNESFFSFASEIKALLTLPFINKKINQEALFHYFVQSRVEHHGETLVSEIYELPASHYFVFDLNSKQFSITKYFELTIEPALGKFNSGAYDNYVSEIKTLLFDAIEKRLRSDIPVGFCLSGGVDSSSIVCMAHQLRNTGKGDILGEKLVAFTAVNGVKGSDESNWAGMVARHLNMEWIQSECVADEMFEKLPEIVYFQESPLISTSTYAQYKVMEAAKNRGIQVLIDGQGSDELFAGYVPFYSSLFLQMLQEGQLKRFVSEFRSLNNSPLTKSMLLKTMVKLASNTAVSSFLKSFVAQNIKTESEYISKNIWSKFVKDVTLAENYSVEPTNIHLASFYSGFYLKNLLRWEDRASMRFSIESRTPFADDLPLAEKLFLIPACYKINKGWNKALLRDAMIGVLPDDVRLRKDKLGFSTPELLWIQSINQQLKKVVAGYDDNNGFIDRSKLLQNWEKIFQSNDLKQQHFAFKYATYLMWKDRFGLG